MHAQPRLPSMQRERAHERAAECRAPAGSARHARAAKQLHVCCAVMCIGRVLPLAATHSYRPASTLPHLPALTQHSAHTGQRLPAHVHVIVDV
jgi:hypothetical protein